MSIYNCCVAFVVYTIEGCTSYDLVSGVGDGEVKVSFFYHLSMYLRLAKQKKKKD